MIDNSAPAFIQKADLYMQLLDHVWLVAVIIAGCKNLGLCDWGILFAKRFIRQYWQPLDQVPKLASGAEHTHSSRGLA
jgi:hypothetical protein